MLRRVVVDQSVYLLLFSLLLKDIERILQTEPTISDEHEQTRVLNKAHVGRGRDRGGGLVRVLWWLDLF